MKKPISNASSTTKTKSTEIDHKIKQKIDGTNDKQVETMYVYNPVVRAVTSGQSFSSNISDTDLDIFACIATLSEQIKKVTNGNLNCVEVTLAAQGNTLDLMFNSLACKAANSQLLSHFETYMRLALKAQSQCRSTYETLAEIKNPRPIEFIKQQNVGLNQQVNNNEVSHTHEKFLKSSNELLESSNGEWLDTGATSASSGTDKKMEAVGVIDRSKDI